MANSLTLMIISREHNAPARITALALTDEVSSQVRAAANAIGARYPSVAQRMSLICQEDDGIEVPAEVFQNMEFFKPTTSINGVEVNESTFGMFEDARCEINSRIDRGYNLEIFLQA